MLLHLLPIIAAGAFSLAIIVERSYFLYWRYPVSTRDFLVQVRQKIRGNDIMGLLELCANQGEALAAKIVKAGAVRAARANDQIQSALEIETHDAISMVRKRIAYLAMLANVATLLGLLGTIAGLIKAFSAVANVDAATRSAMLADGISSSMNATASGLAVAIPTMIAFSVLQSKANRLTEELEGSAMTTMDLLSARLYREDWNEDGHRKEQPESIMNGNVKQLKAS